MIRRDCAFGSERLRVLGQAPSCRRPLCASFRQPPHCSEGMPSGVFLGMSEPFTAITHADAMRHTIVGLCSCGQPRREESV